MTLIRVNEKDFSGMNFDISYTIDAFPRLLEGAMITVVASLLCFVLSLLLGTVLTVVRSLETRPINAVIAIYISFIRGTPVLIQIFLAYYVLPVVGIDLQAFTAGILAVTLNSAAFTTEILRGGLKSVPNGQLEAAHSIGLKPSIIWLKVVLPQAYIASIPPLVNEFTLVVKTTPLLAVITVVELTRVAQQIYGSNYHPIEVLIGAFGIYFFICFPISRASAGLERRFAMRRG
ncbi:MAG: amino acid ABC transporter permease [Gammaproteobacteria bacterium]|nr:amino acid ABC transporter permease [Gammaproteobacteria bacterium]